MSESLPESSVVRPMGERFQIEFILQKKATHEYNLS